MPPKRDAFGTAQQWLKRAKGNLALAKQPKPKDAFWDDLFFDAQQAAEKSIKAVLVHREIDFPKTHNIRSLFWSCWIQRAARSQREFGRQLT